MKCSGNCQIGWNFNVYQRRAQERQLNLPEFPPVQYHCFQVQFQQLGYFLNILNSQFGVPPVVQVNQQRIQPVYFCEISRVTAVYSTADPDNRIVCFSVALRFYLFDQTTDLFFVLLRIA
ncbi:hypothetical protein D3C86_1726560 [compost metagenome]